MTVDPQSGQQPARVPRPARRSLVEFALPTAGASRDATNVAPPLMDVPAPAREQRKSPRQKTLRKRAKRIALDALNETPQAQASGDANGVAGAASKLPSAFGRKVPGQAGEALTPSGHKTATVAKVAEACYAGAVALLTVNVSATLDYARRLIDVKTPGEFIALSAGHACEQWRMIAQRAADVGSVATEVAVASIERATLRREPTK